MTGPRYACPRCGYDLDAVPARAGGVTCPECGHSEPAAPYAMAPWPAPWRLALVMLWPTCSLMAVIVALLSLRPLVWILMIGWPLAIMAWCLAAMIHPMFEAGELARHHALIPDRRRVRLALGGGALLVNLLVTFVAFWVVVLR